MALLEDVLNPRLDRLLTVKEAASILGRSEQSIRWLLHTGKGPKSAMLGGRRVYRESDIAAWIDAAFDEAS